MIYEKLQELKQQMDKMEEMGVTTLHTGFYSKTEPFVDLVTEVKPETVNYVESTLGVMKTIYHTLELNINGLRVQCVLLDEEYCEVRKLFKELGVEIVEKGEVEP